MARDTQRMCERLRDYLDGGDAITAVVPLSTGHSNETYLIEGLDRILRMPPSEEGLLPPYDMSLQHAVLDAVGSAAGNLPVPAVFELCSDRNVLGDEFFVMQRLDGEAFEFEVPDWLTDADSATRSDMCQQWVDAMTAVHRLPAGRMPGPRVSIQQEITHWRDLAREAEDAPPALLEMLDDLLEHPPASSGPPAPVHGDMKIGNCMWHGPRLVALLDWEMAGVGEPLTDVGYLCQFYDQGDLGFANAGFNLKGWWSREQTVAAWEEATGREARDLPRYEALAIAKVSAIIAYGYHLFKTGRIHDPRFEGWGEVVPVYVDLALRRLDR